MSLQVRRFVAVSLTALAVMAGTAATAASASERPVQAVTQPAPDGFDGYPESGHQRPLHFGPFELPHSGTISGGFTWGARD